MKILRNTIDSFTVLKNDQQLANDKLKLKKTAKKFLFTLFSLIVLIGIAYIILSPLIEIFTHAFFSDTDATDPMVYIIARNHTTEKFKAVIKVMKYWTILRSTMLNDVILMIIQVIICSMVGYGFARFDFPFKKILFAFVVVMIVVPSHAIMLPLYIVFRSFDVFGIVKLFNHGEAMNLLKTMKPIYIMTALGCGLNSGIYIYIFNQFFRGLPKEIEEAAFVDGAGTFYTYFRIMLVNAIPSVITVSVFSIVWQYNDFFFIKLFKVSDWISVKVSTVYDSIGNIYRINSPTINQLYLDAAIVLDLLPVLIIYMVLQKYFVEGVERSGIVG